MGNPLTEFVQREAVHVVPESDQKLFVEDVMEDLEQMDESRIIGLGVIPKQLDNWLALYKRS